jgi:hypothetical protein
MPIDRDIVGRVGEQEVRPFVPHQEVEDGLVSALPRSGSRRARRRCRRPAAIPAPPPMITGLAVGHALFRDGSPAAFPERYIGRKKPN